MRLLLLLLTFPVLAGRSDSLGGTRDFTYDAAGNTTIDNRTGGSYTYSYNAAGRMETFRINGFLQASYLYDAMGRQAIRTLTSPLPVTIHSVFDSQGRRIAEYDEATGTLIREYIWNGWEPVALIEGGVVYYIRADHIGRPVFATNSAGVKVWEASYLPFGGVHTSTGARPPNRFPGQWFQTESGLHQNWMRDYDPTTGRYLQADPLGLVDGASVYGYVRQSPQRWTDPTGQFIPAVWACLTNPVCASAVVTAGYLIYDLLCADTTEEYIAAIIKAILSAGNPCKGPLKMICAAPYRGGKGGGGGGGGGPNGGEQPYDGIVYRGGSDTPDNLTPRPQDTDGLSTTLEPKPGKNQAIDTSKLSELCAVCDGDNHVSIRPKDMDAMNEWMNSRGSGEVHPLTQELIDAIVDVVRK